MLKIYIKRLKKRPLINESKLKSIATRIFELENVSPQKDYEVGITLIDDKHIRELNKKYRTVDAPTDVLSFTIKIDEHKLLGDIYISVERALQQVDPKENLEIEVHRLLIHGLLHLLGYDHSEIMFSKQEIYLKNSNAKTQITHPLF